ncbi:L-dopachrome tautomerase-related protein [Lichenicoccus sp.]|uniref:L-dopachrome tautomerase-related protein n=1 Tax=Lichenicoccus sp. TaxID=2781899 RepID=UPI003D0D8EF3
MRLIKRVRLPGSAGFARRLSRLHEVVSLATRLSLGAALAVVPAAARAAPAAQPPPSTSPAKPGETAQPDQAVHPAAQAAAPATDPLTLVGSSDQLAWNGVAIAPDGRVFVEFPRTTGSPGPSLAVLGRDNSLAAYPGGTWNEWSSTGKADPAQAFVGLNAVHLAPDNSLWAVDTGAPGFGKQALPGATKLVRMDPARNTVTRVYVLPPDVLEPKSMIGDVRFHGSLAYITDAGSPGLIVLDLATGSARRLLDHDPSTTAPRPILVDGEILKGPDNKPAMIHAGALEVTPDGAFLYYQPLCGPLYRIPTALLDDPKATPQAVAAGVQFWYDTPALGGTAIGPDGTLYLEDVENDSVLALDAHRALTTILHDRRLHWAAAPVLRDGVLTLPVPQLDRAALFHHGHSQIQYPVQLFARPLPAAQAAPHR